MKRFDYDDPKQVASAEKAIVEYIYDNDIKALINRFLVLEKIGNEYKVIQHASMIESKDGSYDIESANWDNYFYGVFVPDYKTEKENPESNEYIIDMEQLRPYSTALREKFWEICKEVFSDPSSSEQKKELTYQTRAVTYVLDNTEIPVDYYVVGLIFDVMGKYRFDKNIDRK